MLTILPIDPEVQQQAKKHNVAKKFTKCCRIIVVDITHPSLNVELMQPKGKGIYSFRIDRKYRAIFVYRHNIQAIEIVAITVHYH
jgi:Txe/YoeB family toxin of Txe-Axe toxin-antitoxin module